MLKKTTGVSAEHAEITAFLGKGTEFKGVLSCEGTIRVDGKVEGEVLSKARLSQRRSISPGRDQRRDDHHERQDRGQYQRKQ